MARSLWNGRIRSLDRMNTNKVPTSTSPTFWKFMYVRPDTAFFLTIFTDEFADQFLVKIENSNSMHGPAAEQATFYAIKGDQFYLIMPWVPDDANEQFINFVKASFQDLQKMGRGSQQDTCNSGIRILLLALVDDVPY